MQIVDWVEPRKANIGRAGAADQRVVAQQLLENPGEWADLGVGSLNTAWQINAGKAVAFRPAGAFEATTRTVDGERRLYARYVGGDE